MDNTDIGRMATLAFRIVAQTGYQYLMANYDKFDDTEPTYKANDYISVYKQVSKFFVISSSFQCFFLTGG